MQKKKSKVNGDKNKPMLLGGKEGLPCEFIVDGSQLENFSKFNYLGFMLDQQVECNVVGKWWMIQISCES